MRHHEFALQELRPLMQQPELSDEERAHVWWLIERAAVQDMDATRSRVTPYLRGFPKHYEEILCRVERVDGLDLANEVLPGARVEYHVPPGRLVSLRHTFGLRRLTETPALSQVSRLCTYGGRDHPRFEGDLYSPDLTEGASCAVEIAMSPHLRELREYVISRNLLGDDQIIRIFTALDLPLRLVEMGGNAFGERGLKFFCAQPVRSALRVLSLRGGGLNVGAVRAITGSPHLSRLERLDLSSNPIGDEGARLLADADNMSKINTLHLNNCNIGAGGLKALRDSPHLSDAAKQRLREDLVT